MGVPCLCIITEALGLACVKVQRVINLMSSTFPYLNEFQSMVSQAVMLRVQRL